MGLTDQPYLVVLLLPLPLPLPLVPLFSVRRPSAGVPLLGLPTVVPPYCVRCMVTTVVRW